MEGTLNNGMCRCCASEGTFKDLSSKYIWMGEEEIYSDMLQQCFDITLIGADEGQEGGICEVCITQLRNAANFKKQVQHTEEQFKRRLEDNMFKPTIVKLEVAPIDDDGGDQSDNNHSDDMSVTEYEVPIKTETEETKGKKRTKGATTRSKKTKVEDAETSKSKCRDTSNAYVSNILTDLLQVKSSKTKKSGATDWAVTIKSKSKKGIQRLVVEQSIIMPEEKEKVHEVTPKKTLLDKHRHNIRQILLCTNANPIRKYNGKGYCCGYCNEEFPTPPKLKQHSLDEHTDADKEIILRKCLAELVVKLDITDFQCILCESSLINLEDAINHLKSQHNKLWYDGIGNQIIAFKFSKEGVTCPVCSKFYISMKLAHEHMRMHYKNYVCNICNMPFVNMISMRSHRKTHKKGDFACSFCEKIFVSNHKRNDHEKYVHKGDPGARYKCPECFEKFTTYQRKQDHMVEVHGKEPIQLKCLACDLTFSNRVSLTNHTRRDHLMERPHECAFCEKKFYTATYLSHHMLKHTGIRRYKCDICSKAFGARSTLRGHLRIHADDRKYKCEYCDQAFVQKCSLKGHLRAKHKNV